MLSRISTVREPQTDDPLALLHLPGLVKPSPKRNPWLHAQKTTRTIPSSSIDIFLCMPNLSVQPYTQATQPPNCLACIARLSLVRKVWGRLLSAITIRTVYADPHPVFTGLRPDRAWVMKASITHSRTVRCIHACIHLCNHSMRHVFELRPK